MRALVVGASGFIGKVLCRHLRAEGIAVRALIRTAQKGDWNETVVCDLENFRHHEKKIFRDIDTIFYLASIAHNKAPEADYQKINVDLCLDFAARAIANGVTRFVYVSSTKAMAAPGDQVVDETFNDKPKDKYGLSKRRAEEGLLAIDGFEHLAIVRPCLVYGAGVQGNLYLMMSMIDKDVAPALPDTHAERSMISVDDVARALMVVANNPKAHRKIYILGDGQRYSVKHLEKALRERLGKKAPRWRVPGFVFELAKRIPITSAMLDKLARSALYSSAKIERELGWHPTQTLWDVLPVMVDDYRLTME